LATATAVINAYYEAVEGMLVTFPDTLSVSEYFELARYGQVILTEGGRPRQFTDANLPSTSGLIDHEINLATRTIILDDTDNRQNRPVDTPNTAYYHPVPGLSISNFFRGGDTITNLTGVLHWSFAGQTGTDAWRIRPVVEAGYSYAFTPVNMRPAVPNIGGSLKVASFNVLNYFLTVDTTASNSVGSCGASGTLDCRGADSTAERDRQQAKLTEALKGLDADVVGLIELENTPNVDPLAEIVSDLNAVTSPGLYAAINTGVVGTDAIKVGLIYKPSKVTPVGTPMIDNNPVFSRPPVAQFFETTDGARFTVVINHFKSKGCDGATGADLDQLDGQGCFNNQRRNQAAALVDFVNNIVSQTGDPDVLIIGDLNSYAKENPIVDLENAGYTNLVATLGGPGAYSYVFDSQLGYLDHALSTPSLTQQVTGVADWHINTDEIPLFDYNDDVKDTGEATFEEESDVLPLYQANEFRTSDHDPVVIGLNPINYPPTADAGGPYSVVEGGSVTLSATGQDPEGAAVTFDWDLDNNGTFETPGQSVNFSAASITAPATLTVKVKVTDAFGNFTVDEATVYVLYNFNGFFQPVDNLPVFNSVKAGQAIPVKFSLNGNHGLSIFAAGYPKSETIACSSTNPVDGVEETVTAGSSSLSYDPLTDTYIYVWKTDKAWGNTCRQLVVKLNDGTFHRANFKFTK
jgi:predicted extracellular nuclease